MKTSTSALVVFSGVALILGALVACDRSKRSTSSVETPPVTISSAMAESHVLAHLTEQPVVPHLFPAGVYLHLNDTIGTGTFFGCGVVRFGPDGPELLTADRSVTGADLHENCIFEVRLLKHPTVRRLFFSRVKKPNGGSCAAAHTALIALKEIPAVFHIPSKRFDQILKTGWGIPEINGTSIREVRSVFTGMTFTIVGQAQEGRDSNFLIADYNSAQGQGGEVFTDTEGRLWVLFALPSPEEERRMRTDYSTQKKRSLQKGIALLSGPIADQPDTP